MNDESTTIEYIKNAVTTFVREREWQSFHTSKNLSMSISVEAAELMEYFLWTDNNEILEGKKEEIENEVADIFVSLIAFCNSVNIDLAKAFERKLALTKKKYPVEKVRRRKIGKYTKCTDL